MTEQDTIDKTELDTLMSQLNNAIDTLIAFLASDPKLATIGFETQPVTTSEQNLALAKGQSHIPVITYRSEQATILSYYKRFYVAHQASTRFVSRMPGVINCQLPSFKVISLIDKINGIKDQIKALVQNGRNHHQRHQFIHSALPRVMTEQLYRHIHYTQLPIKSMWFGWRLKRQTNNSLTHPQAIKLLKDNIDKPKNNIELQQWQAMINNALELIQNKPQLRIQRQREYKTHPTCAYSYYTEDNQLKRGKISIALPWILLDQANNNLPVRTHLGDFNLTNLAAKNKAKPYIDIFTPMKMIGFSD